MPVLLTLGIVFFLVLPSIADDHLFQVKSANKKFLKNYTKHRDKNSKGKYDPELHDRAYVYSDEVTEHSINDDDDDGTDSSGNRNNRAIAVSRYNFYDYNILFFFFFQLSTVNNY